MNEIAAIPLPVPLGGSSEPENTFPKIMFRRAILELQRRMEESIESGRHESIEKDCPLKHYFTPRDPKYGCHTYARVIFIPKGGRVIGKIHKHSHLNFILLGRIEVWTEFGKKYFAAPEVFVSEIGIKRAVYALEDTLWATVHLTALAGEENLDAIEDELIAKEYREIGFASSLNEFDEIRLSKK